MNKRPIYNVTVIWDEEAKVFVATSDDIPGLVTEAKTFQKIVERVSLIAPELIEDNINNNENFLPDWLSFTQKPFFVPLNKSSGHCA